MVQGLCRFRVCTGLGYRLWIMGFRVQGGDYGISSLGFRV